VDWTNAHLGFNPRSQTNSNALSDFVVADLPQGCPEIDAAIQSNTLAVVQNPGVMTKVAERSIDLVLQHQDVFHVVFENCVRLVRLSQEGRPVLHFVICVGDFMPENRRQGIESNLPGANADISMQRHNHVTAVVPAASYANVPDDASDTPSRYKDSKTVFPHLPEFVMELLVIFNGAELTLMVRVFF
jgi:hypothetical protein